MKQMIETFVTMIFISIICVLFVSMIGFFIEMYNARNYHASVIDRLENSNFQEEYIEDITSEAENRGYNVSIKNVTVKKNRACYKVKLEYSINMEVFSLIDDLFLYKGVIEGYAS